MKTIFRACFETASLFINFCCVLLYLFALDLNFVFVLQVYFSPHIWHSIKWTAIFELHLYFFFWFYVSHLGVYFWRYMYLSFVNINDKEIFSSTWFEPAYFIQKYVYVLYTYVYIWLCLTRYYIIIFTVVWINLRLVFHYKIYVWSNLILLNV